MQNLLLIFSLLSAPPPLLLFLSKINKHFKKDPLPCLSLFPFIIEMAHNAVSPSSNSIAHLVGCFSALPSLFSYCYTLEIMCPSKLATNTIFFSKKVINPPKSGLSLFIKFPMLLMGKVEHIL